MKYYLANNDLPGPRVRVADRNAFHRPQHLQWIRESIGDVDVSNGIRVEDPLPPGQVSLMKEKFSGVGGETLKYVPKDDWDPRKSTEERLGWSNHKLHPLSTREQVVGRDAVGLPKWVRLEKQILKFVSYFVEDVFAERIEQERLRRCHIFYFLEDDSLMVIEPAITNSGIPQGTLVRRHRVPFQTLPEENMAKDELPRPPPRISKEKHITYWDLNRSTDIMIYGSRHRITDCDQFTDDFLKAQGIHVNPKEPEPEDLYGDYRKKMEAVTPKRPYRRPETPRNFGPSEGKVLRFFGRWEDTLGMTKEKRTLVVRYHLEDDTVEVGEIHDVNAGRYKAPLFLKRCKLPKKIQNLVMLPGMTTDHTLLNVVRSQGPGKSIDAILIDNLENISGSVIAKSGASTHHSNYFSQLDFDIGITINIAGRDVLLYDCDDFTRKYYRQVLKRELEPLDLGEEVKKKREKEVPPYTGFGSEADSKTSCGGLEPRAPQRDFFKFMNKDRDGFDSHILRFSARLVLDGKVDTQRKFVVSYFLSDDSILVNLIPEQNSGLMNGRFLKRGRIKKPLEYQCSDQTLDSLYYGPEDLYVGAIVEFNKHTFLLTSADDYVFAYMERPNEIEKFPQSNLRVIIEEVINCIHEKGGIKPIMAEFLNKDPQDTGFVMESIFRDILHHYIGYNLSEHQIVTIIRAFQSRDALNPSLPTENLYSILQTELKRINFQFFDQLEMNLKEKDVNETGMLSKQLLRINLISGFGVSKSQLRLHYINHVVGMLMNSIQENEVDYRKVVFNINWMKNPAKPVAPEIVRTNYDASEKQKSFVPVNYRDFIDYLEHKTKSRTVNYIATEADFKEDDRGRN